MLKYCIAAALNRRQKLWKNTELTWEQLIEELENVERTRETLGQYMNMSKSEQTDIKDVGGFVGGMLKDGSRRGGCVIKRGLITLDADFASMDFIDTVNKALDCSYVIYTTHKHTPEKPRMRLIIPLSRNVSADEYEAAARKTAELVGIDMFDDTTYQPHRMMFYPSASCDGQFICKHRTTKPLDPDKLLKSYQDWRDISQWPVSSRTVKLQQRTLKKQENPCGKPGLIGAFCRAYSIHSAIEKYLPDEYEKCGSKDRYTYTRGSAAAGLVVYDDGLFAYSNHATDPAGGKLCNAFDLVRLHKFGDLDIDADELKGNRLPSFAKMQEFAIKDKAVVGLMQKERMQAALSDFEEDIDGNDDWFEMLEVDGKGRNIASTNNLKLILENDSRLKGRIAYNEFSSRLCVQKPLPWGEAEKREWIDKDDAALRHYIETLYGISNSPKLNDAVSIVADENKFHPVRDYLNSLEWDGIKRAEAVFIDYLGAKNDAYTRHVTRMALTAGVARVFEPGIKYDTMVVLIGAQGQGKSELIRRLGREWASDTVDSLKGKDAYEQLQGYWIIEFSELASLRKTDMNIIKGFMSKTDDIYREAYGRRVNSHKRQCIFFGTSNNYECLKDQTGNRRFLPIDTNTARAAKDIWKDLTSDELDMIWAEAVQLYKNGEPIYIREKDILELAKQQQDIHLEENPLEADIRRFLDMELPLNWREMDIADRRAYIHDSFDVKPEETFKRDKVCVMEIWQEMFYGDRKELTIQKSKEIKDIILKTGEWERGGSMRIGKCYGKQRIFSKIV